MSRSGHNPNYSVDTEQRIVETMIRMHCRARHDTGDVPCAECTELIEYCRSRTAHCPRRPDKPFCSACPESCYSFDMRERIREAMRYSGPRMIYRHPLMAIEHLRHGMPAKRTEGACEGRG